MQVPFVDLGVQYQAIKDELDVEFQKVYAKTAFIMGPAVKEFEEGFAQYCGVKHAIGVGNGTDAITITLKALGIGPGDKVITAANTFIATVEGIVNAGATPVLVDVDPNTYNLDPTKLKELFTRNSSLLTGLKAIIPVHLFGQPADMDPVLEIAREHDLLVIEDACQAHGAEYRGASKHVVRSSWPVDQTDSNRQPTSNKPQAVNSSRQTTGHEPQASRTGSFGDVACFSFYPAKNLGAYGDGGMVVTNNDEVAQIVAKLRDHGSSQKYQHDMVGYDSRLDTLQAAVLLTKLRYLDEWNEKRRRNAKIYDELLSNINGVIAPGPGVLDKALPVYHLYVIYLENGNRDELKQYLQDKGIGTGIHYPTPVHLSKAFEYLGYKEGDFPVTEDKAKKILSLPMYPELTREQIEYVALQIKNAIKS